MGPIVLALGFAAAVAAYGTCAATPPPIMPASPQPQPAAVDPSSMAAARVGTLPTAPAGTVVVRGLDGRSVTLTAADIAKADRERVSVERGGKAVVYSGPGLDDLLRQVGAPLGNRIHGQGVNDVVFVTGRDRYRVVLTLPEVDPSFHTGAKVILADQADGRPLDAHDGPYRLVVDGDQHPSRSVYGVVAVEVKHLP